MFEPLTRGSEDVHRPLLHGQTETYTPRAGRFKAHITHSPSFPSSLTATSPPPRISGLPPRPAQRRPHAEDLDDDDAAAGVGARRLEGIMRPSRKRVESWLGVWWKRWSILVGVPCLVTWTWVSIPFPVADPYAPDTPWHLPSRGNASLPDAPGDGPRELPLDVNFYFFLFVYYGLYLAVALLLVTAIFNLYRLNWWPRRVGGRLSYFSFWSAALAVGWAAHEVDLVDRLRRWLGRDGARGENDWERKTFWTILTMTTMGLPALVCFSVLKRDKRHTYRKSLTPAQKTFLERQLSVRIPASYLRFLWFMSVVGIALATLVAGQAYTSVFLGTLPHSSVDAAVWVWSWVGTTTLLGLVSSAILERKVRSRGLIFIFRFWSSLSYFVFYRNLFARLKNPSDFILLQCLSTLAIIVFYPLQMTAFVHRLLVRTRGYSKSLTEHRESISMGFYARSLAQNVSMVAFLGWLVILHYGPNSAVYPFFEFRPTPEDPYTFRLTFWASSIIWASELASSISVIWIVRLAFKMDLNGVGLAIMREHPDLVPACCIASIHQLMTVLLFLIKLNFR